MLRSLTSCKERRQKFRNLLPAKLHQKTLYLTDRKSLCYLAGFYVPSTCIAEDALAILKIDPDGEATLYYDQALNSYATPDQVENLIPKNWYNAKNSPEILRSDLFSTNELPGFADPDWHATQLAVNQVLASMRRTKYPDEVTLLKESAAIIAIGQKWALEHVAAGMTEHEVYCGILSACAAAVPFPIELYGDFVVCSGPKRRSGPPTKAVLKDGDTLILDFSVKLLGYRSDLANTISVGETRHPQVIEMQKMCIAAMQLAESYLKAQQSCQIIYDAVRDFFKGHGVADHFVSHLGHGIGLSHPEKPFLVKETKDILVSGDTITLEPALYIEGIGGVRIEHNYLITERGFERLSNHRISLTKESI